MANERVLLLCCGFRASCTGHDLVAYEIELALVLLLPYWRPS